MLQFACHECDYHLCTGTFKIDRVSFLDIKVKACNVNDLFTLSGYRGLDRSP